MNRDELHYWTLSDLADALARRDLSPVEVTQAQLERIEALDGQLHAYVTVTAEQALERAKQAELEIGRDGTRGPLHGIPIALKDLCATRGVRTTAGTRILRDWIPDEDACVVERLEATGAIVLGKLQMSEGAGSTHHPDVTPPVNPWDAADWTGISSSGSGVATAAGMCFASLGTDTGGSIRFPSACCGLTGIKPTYGRVSRHGIVDFAASFDHVGPMARCVADAAHVRIPERERRPRPALRRGGHRLRRPALRHARALRRQGPSPLGRRRARHSGARRHLRGHEPGRRTRLLCLAGSGRGDDHQGGGGRRRTWRARRALPRRDRGGV